MIRQSKTAARYAYMSPEIARQLRADQPERLTLGERVAIGLSIAVVIATALHGIYLAWEAWL